jgi:hypothetical protein
LDGRAAANGVSFRLEDEQPRALAEEQPLAIEIERLALLRRHRGKAHEAAELQFLQELRGARDDDIGAPAANEIGSETDRVVSGRARRGQRQHHPLGADRARDVDRQERRPVARDERALHFLPLDPRLIEVGEDLRLAHRRADHDRGARPLERVGGEPRVLDRHARGGKRHRRAAAGSTRLGRRQVIARREAFHFTGELATEPGGVERLDARDSAPPRLEAAEEILASEADGADDSDPRHEYPRPLLHARLIAAPLHMRTTPRP